MDKPFACFDISSSSIKLLVGYELNSAPVVIFCKETPIPNYIVNGRITNPEALSSALREFAKIEDPDAKLSLSISEICLVLPPCGLMIYEDEETTNVVSQVSEISRLDIENVLSLVKKSEIPGENVLVDIIPESFTLDNGQTYLDPPIHKTSSSVSIKAKVHTLPHYSATAFQDVANKAGFRVKRACISTYCQAQLFQTYEELPPHYLLIDLGARLTSISLIGDNHPFSSNSIYQGGDNLTDAIAEKFGISFEQADTLKRKYGYCDRQLHYDPPTFRKDGEVYRQKDLNDVIEESLGAYLEAIQNAVSTLLSTYEGEMDALPIVLTGGGSLLLGLKPFFQRAFPRREILRPIPKTIGARDPGYTSCLGLIMASSRYTGTLQDNQKGLVNVSRKEEPEKGRKKKKRASSYDDEL